jgi:hypothetical protein
MDKAYIMDENTRFLIERMDAMESRIMAKIEALDRFKSKIVGASMVVSGAVSILFELMMRK